MFNWDTSFYSVSQLLNSFPDLLLFTSLLFPNDGWNLTALFVDNSQVHLNIQLLLKAGNYSLANKKLQSIFHAILTLVIYPFIFIGSIECTDSSFLTVKNTYCTTFKSWFKSVGLISINGSELLSQVKSDLFKYQSTI